MSHTDADDRNPPRDYAADAEDDALARVDLYVDWLRERVTDGQSITVGQLPTWDAAAMQQLIDIASVAKLLSCVTNDVFGRYAQIELTRRYLVHMAPWIAERADQLSKDKSK